MDLCTLTGSVNYFPLRVKLYTVTDSTLGILTPRRQESSVKPKLLIPAMHLSAEILKTRGDFPHANGALDSCRAIDAWPPPYLLYRAPRLLITPARLSLLRCEWGRSGGGSHRSVNTGIFDCRSGDSAKALLFIATEVGFLNVKENVTHVWRACTLSDL